MTDTTARAVGTVGIWASVAVALALGLCRMNFNGQAGLLAFLAGLGMLTLAAVVGTAIVRRVPRATRPGARGFQVVRPGDET